MRRIARTAAIWSAVVATSLFASAQAAPEAQTAPEPQAASGPEQDDAEGRTEAERQLTQPAGK